MNLTGEVIKFVRFARQIDQRKLARMAGIAQCTVSKIETGAAELSQANYERIVGALELSEADILHAKNHVAASKRFQ
ncbi:helix-turn-helix transcriptional regulator [Planococcus maritimus]|nr:helix-turn-helix transcriptional regulator [Planococcus sp. SK3692]MDE4086190.1 helix-turn-helix transcriptional regulator [Planococcus maritimus]